MRICILASCRPNIIKQYWLIKECISQWLHYYILHTGQHYSDNMSANFFKELWIPREHINLGVKSTDRLDRFAEMVVKLNTVWKDEMYKPDIVIVQWDTDSDFIVALVAKMMWIKVAHNEAGIRSNSDIPEEYNRRMIDQISDYLFVPTKKDFDRIRIEWIKWNVYLTWNTVCDCINSQNLDYYNWWIQYIFMTLHRDTNTDNEDILKDILEQAIQLKKKTWLPIIFSLHPRTEKMIDKFWFRYLLDEFIVNKPMTYLDTLRHINWASYILTDSGWIQEECCVLKKKCIILRDSTERAYVGSVLWKWNILKAKERLDDISPNEIKNIFNPNKHKNISKEILQIILDDNY